jgi:hypothetical protein
MPAFLTAAPVLEITKVLAEQKTAEAQHAKEVAAQQAARVKALQEAKLTKKQELDAHVEQLVASETAKEQAEQDAVTKAAHAQRDKVCSSGVTFFFVGFGLSS